MNEAKKVPNRTPKTTKTPKDFTIAKSTSLFFLWVSTEAVEVKIVIVKAVPTDRCIKKSSWKLNVSKIKKRQGTDIRPPPIPNKPAKKPTADAAKTINIKKYQYSFIRVEKASDTCLN